MGASDRRTVLVADDDPGLVDLYVHWLDPEYDVRAAGGGEAALDAFDDDVDVALLDRHMPDVTGDEVLARVRDAGVDCRVAMVTAVDPGLDVLDVPFDDYLVKPVTRTDLRDVVDRLCLRTTFEERQREYFALAAKAATLREHVPETDLEADPEFRALCERLAELSEAVEADAAAFTVDDFAAAFTDIDDRSGATGST